MRPPYPNKRKRRISSSNHPDIIVHPLPLTATTTIHVISTRQRWQGHELLGRRAQARDSPYCLRGGICRTPYAGVREFCLADIHKRASLCPPEAPEPPPGYDGRRHRPDRGPEAELISARAARFVYRWPATAPACAVPRNRGSCLRTPRHAPASTARSGPPAGRRPVRRSAAPGRATPSGRG
jgi:hypothetical protein